MGFSLSALKPQVLNVRIQGEGQEEDIVFPIRPLTYTEWNNVLVGVDFPAPPAPLRKLVDGKLQDVPDLNNPAYQKAVAESNAKIQFRRLAIALEGSGVEELKGLSLDEQVEQLRDIDIGIVNALYAFLERMAHRKRAARFQPESVSENDYADLREAGANT